MEVLQTIGICVGSIALVVIAILLLFIWTALDNPPVFPLPPADIIDVLSPPPVRKRARSRSKQEKTGEKNKDELAE